ncbi:hypothetical protein [Catelliglobosispora koreensis]|uniref:hypothetical protein n=1 Tax=Catelliglobosispora koreensis TaxID=129052 RepID=UPI000366CE3D|nr:hypothetical protein [Catelliglobosispora koreensis]
MVEGRDLPQWIFASAQRAGKSDPSEQGPLGTAILAVNEVNLIDGLLSTGLGEEAMMAELGGWLDGSEELNVLRRRHHVLAYRWLKIGDYPEEWIYEIHYRDAGPLRKHR